MANFFTKLFKKIFGSEGKNKNPLTPEQMEVQNHTVNESNIDPFTASLRTYMQRNNEADKFEELKSTISQMNKDNNTEWKKLKSDFLKKQQDNWTKVLDAIETYKSNSKAQTMTDLDTKTPQSVIKKNQTIKAKNSQAKKDELEQINQGNILKDLPPAPEIPTITEKKQLPTGNIPAPLSFATAPKPSGSLLKNSSQQNQAQGPSASRQNSESNLAEKFAPQDRNTENLKTNKPKQSENHAQQAKDSKGSGFTPTL